MVSYRGCLPETGSLHTLESTQYVRPSLYLLLILMSTSHLSHHSQGTISEMTGLALHIFNLTSLLVFPAYTVLTVTSMTPGT